MLRRRVERTTKHSRGATTVLVAICMVVLLSVVALTVDAGMIFENRRRLQAAADAAAMAAATDLYQNYRTNNGSDPLGSAATSAQAIASANGFTNGTSSTVTVHIPPTGGPFASKAGYAEVIIQYNQPRGFSAIWSSAAIPVSARAVGQGLWTSSGNGIILLDPTGSGALDLTGNANLTVNNAAIVIDSNSSQALIDVGNGNITAPTFYIAGSPGTLVSGNGKLVGVIDSGATPTPDPLAYLPEPNPASLTTQSASTLNVVGNFTRTLNAGRYIGGMSFTGNGSVTFNPGIYYLDGGGLSVTGNVSLSGSGVMLYNAPSSSSDDINIVGNSAVTLSPPTSGIYQGISIFQDRTSNVPVNVTGNSNMNFTGTFYAADAKLNITGNTGTNLIGSQYVSYDLKTTGNGNINVSWNATSTARFRSVGLVE